MERASLPAAEVFTPNGYPTNSYVKRGLYEEQLRKRLDQPHPAIIEISGPSRTGKTALVKRCLEMFTRKEIWLRGNLVKSIDNFWQTLNTNLGIHQTTSSTKVGGKLGMGALETNITHETSHTYKPEIEKIVEQLIKQQPILIIDDFHRISQETRAEMIRILKSLTEATDVDGKALKVIVILIPTRQIHDDNIWREVEGRVTLMRLPLWKTEDLTRIVTERLYPGVGIRRVYDMAVECYGLPYIMQMLCLEYWEEHLKGELIRKRAITIDHTVLDTVLKNVGKTLWYQGNMQIYAAITSPNNNNPIRLERKDGSTGNIYQMILYALTSTDFPANTDIEIQDDIHVDFEIILQRVIKVVSDKSSKKVTERAIDNALAYMHIQAEKKYQEILMSEPDNPTDPILEYETGTMLTIHSPSFLVALRHIDDHQRRFKRSIK